MLACVRACAHTLACVRSCTTNAQHARSRTRPPTDCEQVQHDIVSISVLLGCTGAGHGGVCSVLATCCREPWLRQTCTVTLHARTCTQCFPAPPPHARRQSVPPPSNGLRAQQVSMKGVLAGPLLVFGVKLLCGTKAPVDKSQIARRHAHRCMNTPRVHVCALLCVWGATTWSQCPYLPLGTEVQLTLFA